MKIDILNNDKNREITISQISSNNGILLFDVKMIQDEERTPESFMIKWKMPSIDCYSVWIPDKSNKRGIKPNWYKVKTESRLASFMPLQSVVSISGKNRFAISVSDAVTPITIGTGVCEEDACIDCQIEFFTMPVAPVREYRAILRIDTRDIEYYDSLYDTVEWWEKECGYKPAFIPESAKVPVNSLWYSYHQNIDVEDIIEECRLSKEFGMEVVIVDDGWQTDDNSRGYAFCGDWEVAESKIPDMKDFVKRVQNTGMKFMLWYSVPFIGIHSKNFDRFKDMLLDGTGNERTYWALDPRYKEVREFLIETYKKALEEWNLDGFKLDFIDSFCLSGKSLEYDERRDYQCLEDAIDVLMTDITEALNEINPNILIEFRQSYVGPAIRKYGNMFRAGDCPNDAITNRESVINLRLTSGNTPVHSDMLMWNYDEPVENAAVQIGSVLYSVPQISMKINNMSDEHKKMLKFYLDFWKDNRDILLDGKLVVANPECGYSIARAKKNGKAVCAVYSDCLIERNAEKELYVVNVSWHKELIFKDMYGKNFEVVNCMGEMQCKGVFESNICTLDVPLGGIVFVK